MNTTLPEPVGPPPPGLVPDPEVLRARLAELGREQELLRRLLRVVLRYHAPTPGGEEVGRAS